MSFVKLFNNQFREFLDDVIKVYPNDSNIKAAKFFITNIININPVLLIKLWYRDVAIKYKTNIDKGDFYFFLNKDYQKDVEGREDPEMIIKTIDIIKTMMKELTEENKHLNVT